jgi:hypothetical protein
VVHTLYIGRAGRKVAEIRQRTVSGANSRGAASKHMGATNHEMKKRPGGTTHLSISLPADEAKILKRRASVSTAGTSRAS